MQSVPISPSGPVRPELRRKGLRQGPVGPCLRSPLDSLDELRALGLVNLEGAFFPSVHYPPITMYPRATAEEILGSYRAPDDGLFSLYVHVPFCASACAFCHYPVQTRPGEAEMAAYVDLLIRELDLWRARLRMDRIPMRSILMGGGTPTYLPPRLLERLLSEMAVRLDLASCTQVTVDVDPMTLLGTEGSERLRIMRAAGIDRLTIGLQSLDDATLARMGRHHRAAQGIEAVEASRRAGFGLNIEFIFGYPGDAESSWRGSIERAVQLPVDEIQIYRLKLIPYGDKTSTLAQRTAAAAPELPGERETLSFKELAQGILRAHGFEETLTRVFSRDDRIYSHYAFDQCCGLTDQIGIGLTAFSSLRDRFCLNPHDLAHYVQAVEEGRLPMDRGMVRSPEEQARWAIVLPLKNLGVRKRTFLQRTGFSLDEVFRPRIELLKQHGLLREDERELALTSLGRFYADEVCHQFQSACFQPFPPEAYAAGPLNPYLGSAAGVPSCV